MAIWKSLTLAAALVFAASICQAAPVLMISVDGLRPADVLEADQRGLKVPTLKALAADGLYASGVHNVLPTVTYPNHTTLITGVWPSRHGIANNRIYDPAQVNMGAWYWYARDIKVKTLWDSVHEARGVTASFSWPVSVGADAVDYIIPEYWRARTAEDLNLLRALSTKGLIEALEPATGIPFADIIGESVKADEARAQYTAALISAKRPTFTTLHLVALDHNEHEYGPGSPEANAILEALDGTIARLIATARKAEPDLMVAIVSDHGFAKIEHDINLIAPFAEASLINLDPVTKKPLASSEVGLWGGASVAVVLTHPDDTAVQAKVKAVLAKLAAQSELGIAQIADKAEIARIGGTAMASYWIDFKPGYQMSQLATTAPVSPGSIRGTHGYFPAHPEMRATFILSGPNLPRKGALGEIDMRDIAPTLAKLMQVRLPEADGKPLF